MKSKKKQLIALTAGVTMLLPQAVNTTIAFQSMDKPSDNKSEANSHEGHLHEIQDLASDSQFKSELNKDMTIVDAATSTNIGTSIPGLPTLIVRDLAGTYPKSGWVNSDYPEGIATFKNGGALTVNTNGWSTNLPRGTVFSCLSYNLSGPLDNGYHIDNSMVGDPGLGYISRGYDAYFASKGFTNKDERKLMAQMTVQYYMYKYKGDSKNSMISKVDGRSGAVYKATQDFAKEANAVAQTPNTYTNAKKTSESITGDTKMTYNKSKGGLESGVLTFKVEGQVSAFTGLVANNGSQIRPEAGHSNDLAGLNKNNGVIKFRVFLPTDKIPADGNVDISVNARGSLHKADPAVILKPDGPAEWGDIQDVIWIPEETKDPLRANVKLNYTAKGKLDVTKTGETPIGVEKEKVSYRVGEDVAVTPAPSGKHNKQTKQTVYKDVTEDKFNFVWGQKPLAGVTYEIADKGGKVVDTITTKADGKVSSKELVMGDYTIQEVKAPAGIVVNPEKVPFKIDFEGNLNSDGLVVVGKEFSNKATLNTLDLLKNREITSGYNPNGGTYIKGPAEGIQFPTRTNEDIKAADGTVLAPKGSLVGVMTTNKEGHGLINPSQTDNLAKNQLPAGKYVANEAAAGIPYQTDKKSIEFDVKNADNSATKTFNGAKDNILQKNKITGLKVGKKINGGSREDELHPLKDVEFTVTAIDVEGVKPGTVAATVKTDANGEFSTPLLPYGKYKVEETKTPNGYKAIRPFEVMIDQDSSKRDPYYYMLEDDRFTSGIRINKVDSETGENIKVEGVTFNLLNDKKEIMTLESADGKKHTEFTTDATGYLGLPDRLTAGTYYLQEVKAPTGYVLSPEPLKFVVDEKDAPTEGYITLTFENTPQKGKINVLKKADQLVGAKENDGVTDFVFEQLPQADVEFDVVAATDIVTPDGTVRLKKGEIADHIVTTKDGKASSKELYLGSYELVETKAPDGVVLGNPTSVTIEYAGQDVSVTNKDVDVNNELQTPNVDVAKVAEVNELTAKDTTDTDSKEESDSEEKEEKDTPKASSKEVEGGTTEGTVEGEETETPKEDEKSKFIPIPGIEFTFKLDEDVKNVHGEVIAKKGATVGISETDKEGHANLNKQLPFSKYTVQETGTKDNLILDDKVHELELTPQGNAQTGHFKVFADKFEQGQEPITDDKGEAIHNFLYKAPIIVEKFKETVNGNDKEGVIQLDKDQIGLENVTFDVMTADKTVIDTIKINSIGKGQSQDLPVGEYWVKETATADESHMVSEKVYFVEISKNGTTVTEVKEVGEGSKVTKEDKKDDKKDNKKDVEKNEEKVEGKVDSTEVTKEPRLSIGTYEVGKDIEEGSYSLQLKGETPTTVTIVEGENAETPEKPETENPEEKAKAKSTETDVEGDVEGEDVEAPVEDKGNISLTQEKSRVKDVELKKGMTVTIAKAEGVAESTRPSDVTFIDSKKDITGKTFDELLKEDQERVDRLIPVYNVKGSDKFYYSKELAMANAEKDVPVKEDSKKAEAKKDEKADKAKSDKKDEVKDVVQKADTLDAKADKEEVKKEDSKKEDSKKEEVKPVETKYIVLSNSRHVAKENKLVESDLEENVKLKAEKETAIINLLGSFTESGIIQLENDFKKGEMEFSKTDVSGEKLVPGATIVVQGLDEHNSSIHYEFISDGKPTKMPLVAGNYSIKETIAPEGYVLNETEGKFVIMENGEVVKAHLVNELIKGTADFEKTDATDGKVIPGAEIKIKGLSDLNKDIDITFISKAEGNKIENLPYGEYEISETQAPDGYVKTTETAKFVIKENGEIVKAHLDNERVKPNEPKKPLSQTDKVLGAGVLVGLVVIAGTSVYYIRNRKKED